MITKFIIAPLIYVACFLLAVFMIVVSIRGGSGILDVVGFWAIFFFWSGLFFWFGNLFFLRFDKVTPPAQWVHFRQSFLLYALMAVLLLYFPYFSGFLIYLYGVLVVGIVMNALFLFLRDGRSSIIMDFLLPRNIFFAVVLLVVGVIGSGIFHKVTLGEALRGIEQIKYTIRATETFEEILRKTPEKKVGVAVAFSRGLLLDEVLIAAKDSTFEVRGFRHRSGESNGGCGVARGETVEQALQSCFRDHTLFLGRRIEMEKQTLLTVTDPGLRSALTKSIREAEKKQELRITGFDLYGRAKDLKRFKDSHAFVETMQINMAEESPAILSPSGAGMFQPVPINMSAPGMGMPPTPVPSPATISPNQSL